MLFGAVVVTSCNNSASKNAKPIVFAGSPVPATKPLPDPELGEVFTVDEWSIQMPKGYELQSQEQRAGVIAATWANNSSFTIITFRLMQPKGKAPSLEQLRKVLHWQMGWSVYLETEPEVVPIGGRNFERVFASCNTAKMEHIVHGFQYLSIGQPSIAMIYQGGAGDDESLRAADAAARSLRQR